MTTLEDVRALPGLDAYLDEVEERLAAAVESHGGVVAAASREALAAGGKRLRPRPVSRSSSSTWRPSSTTT
jgi:geranylgeranyl pyrophosphate synthase